MACYAAIAPAAHDKLQVFSREANAGFAININEVAEAKPMHNWSDYVVGVARELARDAVPLKGADIYIASEVPAGSGLSSSAAIEVAIAMALLDGRELQPLEIAKLCQRAEGQFVGMPCGIMDQYAAVFGQKNAAIQIDCRSLTHNYVELPPNLRIIAVNSMVKHELGTSAYRERVAECRAAVEAIQQRYPEVQSLRDVTPEMFVEVEAQIPEIPRKRARHVITDSQRVLALGKAAEAGDLAEMGQLFVDSHRSMQHDYEITCAEIDFLVERALRIPAVYGARMTGGGFGGCTVNLLAPEVEERFRRELAADYKQKFNLDPIFYDCVPSPGASRM